MENKVPKIILKSGHRQTRPWVWLTIIGVLLLFMNQNVMAQTPCQNRINFTLVGVDATTATANDAKIRISGALSGDNKIGYSVGSTYTGPNFAGATKFSALTGGYISETLPTPTNTAGTDYTIRVYSEDGSCYTEDTFTLPYVNFNSLPVNPDINVAVTKTGGDFINKGGTVTITVAVQNSGTGPATGVIYNIGIPAGLTDVTTTPSVGTYNNGVWTIGTLAAGASAVNLTITGTVSTRGVKYLTANLSAMNETDIDSSPTTNNAGEDDQGSVCISTPFDYCSNDEYTITLPSYTGIKWFKGATEITSGNASSNSVRLNGDGSMTVFSVGEYSYTMTVGPNACLSGGCCPIKIEAGNPPVLVAPQNQSICFNARFNSVIAQNTYTPNSTNGAIIYEWYNDNGTSNPTTGLISGQTTLELTTLPTAIGVYKYKLKAYETGHENCADSVTVTLEIKDIPTPTIASVAPVCEEGTISLTADGAGSGGSYEWTGPANFTANSATPTRANAIEAYEGTYTVTVTNGVACSATASVAVVVNPIPVPPIARDTVFCAEGAPAVLVAKELPGHTLVWYDTNSTGGTPSNVAPTHPPTTAGTNYYYVSQKDANGCESHRDQLTVKVNAKPGLPVALDKTYCQGATAVALIADGAALHEIVWYGKSSTGGLTTEAPVPLTNEVGKTTYYVSQKEISTGCESDREDVIVTVNLTPPAPTVAAVTYCEQETPIALTASHEVNNTVLWYVDGGTTTTAPTPNTSLAGLTYFYVSQSTPGGPGVGCESGMAAIPVTVNPKPVATVIAVNSLCVGSVSQNNAQLILTRYRNSDEVSYNIGSTYGTPTPTAYATVPSGGVFASNLPNPTIASQDYTVRIKNVFNCTIDVTKAITKKDCECPGGYCEPATVTKTK